MKRKNLIYSLLLLFTSGCCIFFLLVFLTNGHPQDNHGTATLSPNQNIRQVTTDQAPDYHVKWSPDGKILAFTSQRSGEPKIWLVPAEGGDPAMLETGLSGDHHISWAPDSKHITFDARYQGRPNIFTISLDGEKPKRLSEDGAYDFQPYWSPDGSRIAFASLRSGNEDIWIMPAEGGKPTQLTHHEDLDCHPVWSPDGSKIAFTSDRSGNMDIWIIPTSGGEAKQLTFHESRDDQASWSPDGTQIAFMSERSGKRDIWIIFVSGGEPVRFTEESDNSWPTWSPDGSKIAFASKREGENNDIWVKDVKQDAFPILKGPYLGQKPPGMIPKLFAPGIISTCSQHSSVYFSRDGREVYFSCMFPRPSVIMYMCEEKGQWTSPRVVCEGLTPGLAPDGKTVFFSTSKPTWKLYKLLKTANGWTEPELLPNHINFQRRQDTPYASADRTLYFCSMYGEADGIYRALLRNDEYMQPERIEYGISNEFTSFSPYVAPDKSYMIFSSIRPGYGISDLYISFHNADGSWTEPKNMGPGINTSAKEAFPFVTFDGKYLFFMSNRISELNKTPIPDGPGNVYWVDAKIIDELRPKK